MTYPEALQYLEGFLNYEKITTYRYREAFSLDRMRRFLERLGSPHRRYPCLHVAGTKGKGSTCAMAASILKAAGFRVGLYTSPHLISFRERIQVDGEPIPEEAVVSLVCEVKSRASQELTYFEVTTACAFLAFAWEKVDVAVIEVGMGGRLDATNVVEPDVTAVTPISLDHMDQLGQTIEKITREKAGILKPNVPVVVASQDPHAGSVLIEESQKRPSPLHWVAEEVKVPSVQWDRTGTTVLFKTPEETYPPVFLPLLGAHQVINASVALRMVELWARAHGGLKPLAASEGFARVRWPGRCQFIEGNPPLLLDGAHNAASAQALKDTVTELFPDQRVSLIFGTSVGKDLRGMAKILGPWCERLFITQAQVPRAESLQRIFESFHPWHPKPVCVETIPQVLEEARRTTGPDDLMVITGSLFVVGEALQLLKEVPVS